MSAKDRGNLNIFTAALFTVFQMTQCIVLTVQCFFIYREAKVLRFFCQQGIKGLP